MLNKVTLDEHYDPHDFDYDQILKAWQAINGPYSIGRFFFTAHLINVPFGGGGNFMAFRRRPEKKKWIYVDTPFDANQGYLEEGDAELAIWNHHLALGWRIREINPDTLPMELDSDLIALIKGEC